MPQVLWGGKLTIGPKIMMNLNNIWAWISGDARDPQRMKERMKQGYEGEISEYMSRYDELAGDHYLRCAQELMEGFSVSGMEVLELACGTGIISEIILEQGSKRHPLRFGSPATSALFISNPFHMRGITSLLSTHPPMKERIKRLRSMH